MPEFGRYFEEFNVGDVYKHWRGITRPQPEGCGIEQIYPGRTFEGAVEQSRYA